MKSDNDYDLPGLVIRLYQARREAREAKKARAEKREEVGPCEYDDGDIVRSCWSRYDLQYDTLTPPPYGASDFCKACRQLIPFAEDYHKKANAAGAALRAVLHAGRKLSKAESNHNQTGDCQKAYEAENAPLVVGFGDYVRIEQKRYGAENEMYLHKAVGTLQSNTWVDVPVQAPATETIHSSVEDVVACVCCGVCERNMLRFRLSDCQRRTSGGTLSAGSDRYAGDCTKCGGPVFHRDGKPGEYDHKCRKPNTEQGGIR